MVLRFFRNQRKKFRIELKILNNVLEYFLIISMAFQPETAVAVSCLLTAGEKKAARTHNWSSWAVPGKVCTACSTLALSVTILNCIQLQYVQCITVY